MNPLFIRKQITNLPPSVTAKWDRQVLDEGFVPFPKRLLRCLGLIFEGQHQCGELAVVLAIADYRRPQMSRGPSLDFLAFNAGLAVEEFEEHLERLISKGLVKRDGPAEAMELDLGGLEAQVRKHTESSENTQGED